MTQENEEQSTQEQDEDIGMDAGFSGTLPEPSAQQDPKPDPINELEQEPATEPEPEPAAKPEPGVVTPSAEEALLTKFTNLIDGRLRNHTGHVNKILDERIKTITATDAQAAKVAAQEAGGDTPNDQQIRAALKDGEKMKALTADFPEFGEALLEAHGAVAADIEKRLAEKFKAPEVDTSQFAQAGDIQKVNETLITIAHRSWKSDVKTPEFQQWIASQDEATQALADSYDPEDAITLMDGYYEHRKVPAKPAPAGTASPKTRLAAAAQPASTGRTPAPQVIDEDDAMMIGFNS